MKNSVSCKFYFEIFQLLTFVYYCNCQNTGEYTAGAQGIYKPDALGVYANDGKGAYAEDKKGAYSPDARGSYEADNKGSYKPSDSKSGVYVVNNG